MAFSLLHQYYSCAAPIGLSKNSGQDLVKCTTTGFGDLVVLILNPARQPDIVRPSVMSIFTIPIYQYIQLSNTQ